MVIKRCISVGVCRSLLPPRGGGGGGGGGGDGVGLRHSVHGGDAAL